jgi:cystathionine gamma-lyase/cystathionine beta-lyase
MVSFTLKGDDYDAAMRFATSLNIISLAESLGGVESLVNHPASMTHGSIPKEEREKAGVVDGLLRLSIGVEDIDDLLADIGQALDKV